MKLDSKVSRKEFYEKLSRKSGSENTPANAKTALNNFELFCKQEYKKTLEEVIEELIKLVEQDGNQKIIEEMLRKTKQPKLEQLVKNSKRQFA